MKRRFVEQGYKNFIGGYLLNEVGDVYSSKSKRKLKQFVNNKGYYRFQVSINGSRKWYFTHITVVNLFGDSKGKRMLENASLREMNWSIDHIDGNKANNRRDNLEIVTHGKNVRRYHKNKE